MNTTGRIFRLTTFGESHGEAIGGVVDGMPAGIPIDMDFIQQELNRRRPGQSSITTARNEADLVELLSGVFEDKSTGCPIGFIVRNTNQHSNDYDNMRQLMPTIPTLRSMVCATIVAADAHQLASPSVAVSLVLWLSWHCAS